ncbi:hypothetical protein ACFOUR_14170 [Halovivax cerinus]|uniref:Uncharacterized protein n=1 Tax=Halovivax cerinus TaxID=1487865 RepID=A0ABD5NR34_9EURY
MAALYARALDEDDAPELVDLLADLGLEGAVAWVFRLLGILAVLAGIGGWCSDRHSRPSGNQIAPPTDVTGDLETRTVLWATC